MFPSTFPVFQLLTVVLLGGERMRLAQELNGNIAPLFPGSSTVFVTYTVLAKVCNKTVHEEPWERCYYIVVVFYLYHVTVHGSII